MKGRSARICLITPGQLSTSPRLGNEADSPSAAEAIVRHRPPRESKRGIFITHRMFLEGSTGGVQVCTREYINVIQAGGIDLTVLPFDGDRRLLTRIRRLVDSSPYFSPAEPSVHARIHAELKRGDVDFVFLNQVSLATLGRRLRAELPKSVRLILLSHGMESTDLIHLVRLRHELPLTGRVRPSAGIAIGRVIRAEAASRANLDAVFALCPFDVELERWMGAKNVDWLPRIVTPAPLAWRPSGRRLGFAGTLDHAPNLEGLVATLDALQAQTVNVPRVRVVGGPANIGLWLAKRYPQTDFLGRLSDEDLAKEASSWSGFLHPIFCTPRGCSTKLAGAIAWQIPIVTTEQGRRGYVWREGKLLEAETPQSFARLATALLDQDFADKAQADVAKVAATSPTLADVSTKAQRLLDALGEPA